MTSNYIMTTGKVLGATAVASIAALVGCEAVDAFSPEKGSMMYEAAKPVIYAVAGIVAAGTSLLSLGALEEKIDTYITTRGK